ncbi:MAG TPA: DNA primase [Bacteroidales bacterium]|nr:DNA primase [Bacteroidales bacterium]
MIDQITINRILDAARIEEVVGEFVHLRKRGVNYLGLCPFHDDKTPSFSVSPAKGICKCFSCGKGGNVVHFIMEHEQLSYYEALKWLAKKYHIEVVEKQLSPEELQSKNERESMFVLNEFARDFFKSCLKKVGEGMSIGLKYFLERGLREDTIEKFQLGYAPDERDAFTKNALAKGYQKDFLLKTGLSVADEQGQLFDRYRGRVIFPIHGISGKIRAFGGRILKKDAKAAKYINSPESEIYSKSAELYGIYFARQAIVKQDRCYLVEGYTDVLSLHQSGVENVVASSGTALTKGQIQLIHRFTDNITVLYDGDAAGIKASLRGIDLLLEEGLNVKVVLLPEGEDPDSFARGHSASALLDYLRKSETDFIRFKTEVLLRDAGDDPVRRAKLIEDIVESISLIPNNIIRSEYVKECSRLLDSPELLIQKEVDKKRRKYIERLRQQRGLRESPGTEPAYTPAEPLQQPIPTQADAQKKESTPFSPYDEHERNLMRMIVRYGEQQINLDKNLYPENFRPTVLEFISMDLENEEIEFQHPVYKLMYKEALAHHKEPHFVAERFFLNHHRAEISLMAGELISEEYELSKIHSRFQVVVEEKDRLHYLVPQFLEELKWKIVKEELAELRSKLKIAEQNKDESTLRDLLEEIKILQELDKELARSLGERIITP